MTEKQAEQKYNEYIELHRSNVKKAYYWLQENIGDTVYSWEKEEMEALLDIHDLSKYDPIEYYPYLHKFFPSSPPDSHVNSFEVAWNHHQKTNPHHWQYWLLIKDRGLVEALPMPNVYIVEMVCDWLSFSMLKNEPREILSFWEKNKELIVLHPETRNKVEEIIKQIEGVTKC